MSAATAYPVPPLDDLQERMIRIRVLLKQDDDTRFHLGREFEELFQKYGNHGNGTYEKCLQELSVDRVTAWRWRNHFRTRSGLKTTMKESLLQTETNSSGQAAPVDSSKPNGQQSSTSDAVISRTSDAVDELTEIHKQLDEEAKRQARTRRIPVSEAELREIESYISVLAPKYQTLGEDGRPDKVLTIMEALRREADTATMPIQ